MEIIKISKDYKAIEESMIALGNFDGVHAGHQQLLNIMVENSKKFNIKSSVLIFREHTKNLLKKKKQNLLTSNEEKYRIFKNIGVDIVYEIEFDEYIMTLSPEDFVKDFLIKNLKIRGINVGFDYSFGYMAKGNVKLLKKIANEKNIILKVLEPVEKNGVKISSTLIRDLIKNGEIKKANELLTHNYKIDGKIIHGKSLGHTMGYPTANIEPTANYVIPRNGVYDTDILIDGKRYKAATNIGKNPTIENSGVRVEAHILDFDGDLYDKEVSLEILKFIRPEKKFESVEELFEQIAKDTEEVGNRI